MESHIIGGPILHFSFLPASHTFLKMDKLSSVIAAVDASKLPTEQQVNNYIDYVLKHIVAPLEADDSTRLSESGRVLAHDLRELLLAYKQLGTNKNCASILKSDVLC